MLPPVRKPRTPPESEKGLPANRQALLRHPAQARIMLLSLRAHHTGTDHGGQRNGGEQDGDDLLHDLISDEWSVFGDRMRDPWKGCAKMNRWGFFRAG